VMEDSTESPTLAFQKKRLFAILKIKSYTNGRIILHSLMNI